MKFNNILVNIAQHIATISINRPRKLNALNIETIQELHEVLSLLEVDKNVKVLVITGSEDKAFVAGADISEFANFSPKEGLELSKKGQHLLFNYIEDYNKPIIAAINGFALGGGLELAMACHFRIASDNAKMGLPEVSLGVIPGYGGTQRLPQLVGKGNAMEMILTANMVEAQKALQIGLVNQVTTPEELLPYCYKIATKICTNSPLALAEAINAINANYRSHVNGFEVEIEAFGNCFGTNDFVEGTTAFLEKRKANFKGN